MISQRLAVTGGVETEEALDRQRESGSRLTPSAQEFMQPKDGFPLLFLFLLKQMQTSGVEMQPRAFQHVLPLAEWLPTAVIVHSASSQETSSLVGSSLAMCPHGPPSYGASEGPGIAGSWVGWGESSDEYG